MTQERFRFNPPEIIKHTISSYNYYCDGFVGGNNSSNYLLGLVLGIATAPIRLSHEGSQILDEINAFDRAETEDTYLGQINMSTVSSFCGPQGLIWGYDVVPSSELRMFHPLTVAEKIYQGKREIPTYSAKPLLKATKRLFGTKKEKHFPLLPGAHVPCAGSCIKKLGETHLYAAVGIGIPKDRSRAACVLMEDAGLLPTEETVLRWDSLHKSILLNVAKSIVEIGNNQRVEYEEIFLDMKDVPVGVNEMGCALVAAPYFRLARKAIPERNLTMLIKGITELENWEKLVEKDFLTNATA